MKGTEIPWIPSVLVFIIFTNSPPSYYFGPSTPGPLTSQFPLPFSYDHHSFLYPWTLPFHTLFLGISRICFNVGLYTQQLPIFYAMHFSLLQMQYSGHSALLFQPFHPYQFAYMPHYIFHQLQMPNIIRSPS